MQVAYYEACMQSIMTPPFAYLDHHMNVTRDFYLLIQQSNQNVGAVH
jgi:hypothetical protein